MSMVELGSLVAAIGSIAAFVISTVAVVIARKSWEEAHRPLVTARIVFEEAGNAGIALNLMVRNTGNRPAKDVRITVNEDELERVLTAAPGDVLAKDVKRCLRETIPILENAESVTAQNSFGFLSSKDQERTWESYGLEFNAQLRYKDFEGDREFRHYQNLKLADNASFAGGGWGKAR